MTLRGRRKVNWLNPPSVTRFSCYLPYIPEWASELPATWNHHQGQGENKQTNEKALLSGQVIVKGELSRGLEGRQVPLSLSKAVGNPAHQQGLHPTPRSSKPDSLQGQLGPCLHPTRQQQQSWGPTPPPPVSPGNTCTDQTPVEPEE